MKILKELLRRPIAFQRPFVDITGSVTAALFLSQACYWSEHVNWGWFYKTQQQWEQETGLSRHEQDGARRKLLKIGVIEEERRGVPAKMYYHVKADILANLIAEIRQSDIAEIRQDSLPESGNLYKEAETTHRLQDNTRIIERITTQPKPITTIEEELYGLYPRRVGKRVAFAAISKALRRIPKEVPGVDARDWLMKRVMAFGKSLAGQAGEFTPHPSTWFNQSRYLDDEREWNRSRDGYNGNGNHRAPSADPVEDMTVRNHREAITNYAKRGLHFILCNADLCEACANEKRKFPQIITPTQERERERLAAQ